MGTLTMIGQLVLSLSILIILHELGHYSTAKWFKTRVEKFFLFFNPYFSLIKAKKIDGKWNVKTFSKADDDFPEDKDPDNTTYGIGWLPLGGYVKISGMIDESMDKEQMAAEPQPWEFRTKPAWQRLIIMLAGVFVNFVLGFLIMGFMLWHYGEAYLPTSEVNKYGIYADSLGQELGLKTGDKILKFGDKPFDKFNDRLAILELVLNGSTTITVDRDGKETVITPDPAVIKSLAAHKNQQQTIFTAQFPFIAGKILKDSPADKAGIKKEDKLLAVDHIQTPYFTDFLAYVSKHPGKEVLVTVQRKNGAGQPEELQIPAKIGPDGKLGIAPYGPDRFFEYKHIKYSLAQALPAGVKKGWGFIDNQLKGFGKMFSGKIKATESLGGFGAFAKMYGSKWDWERFWRVTAIVSLLLGFINLLPIPALDGGYALFLLFEVVTGIKPSDKFVETAVTIGFALLMGLFLFSNGLDVWRAFQH